MIGCAGYFGFNNYGDEIFLEVWKEKLGFHKAITIMPNDILDDIDKIIIGGGDLIWPYQVNNNYFHQSWYENNRKVYIYGIGAPLPEKDNIKNSNVLALYRKFFNDAEYLSVRDLESYCYVKDYLGISKVQLVSDLAWNFNCKTKIVKKHRTIGITYRRNPKIKIDDIVKLCIYLIDAGYNILLIPLQDGYFNTRQLHKIILEEVQRFIPYANINITQTNLDTAHKYATIASCEGYITLAFHGLLTALKERIPTLCLINDNKFEQLVKQLEMPFIICNNPGKLIGAVKFTFSKEYEFNEHALEYIKAKAEEDLTKFIAQMK